MEMTYDGALVLPANCVVMDEEEMMYVEGGYALAMKRSYLNKSTCLSVALSYVGKTGLSKTTLAHEIYAHAFLYYASSIASINGAIKIVTGSITGKVAGGLTLAVCRYIKAHANPIDLGSGTYGRADSRQWAYDLIWRI